MFYTNAYIDKESKENLIQFYSEDNLFAAVSQGKKTTFDMFVQQGELIRPGFWQETTQPTFQVGDVVTYSEDWTKGGNQDYINVNIRADRRQVIFTSQEYGLLEWMVAIGGIASSMMGSLGITASILSRYIFITEIIKKLYLVKYTTNNVGPSKPLPWTFARSLPKEKGGSI